MKTITRLSLLLCLALSPAAVAGPEDGAAAPAFRDSGDVVALSGGTAGFAVTAGSRIELTLVMDIDPRWHLYAHEDTTFYGIDLELPPEHPLREVQVDYPSGREAEFFGQQVRVLSGRHEIGFAATVPDDLAPGEYEVALTLAVQACDHSRCLAPAFLPVAVKVRVLDNS
jgi:hypothetical protein